MVAGLVRQDEPLRWSRIAAGGGSDQRTLSRADSVAPEHELGFEPGDQQGQEQQREEQVEDQGFGDVEADGPEVGELGVHQRDEAGEEDDDGEDDGAAGGAEGGFERLFPVALVVAHLLAESGEERGLAHRVGDDVVVQAVVELDGVKKEISLALVDGVAVGDYVILHVGYALSRLDAAEAERTLALFAEIDDIKAAQAAGEVSA